MLFTLLSAQRDVFHPLTPWVAVCVSPGIGVLALHWLPDDDFPCYWSRAA